MNYEYCNDCKTRFQNWDLIYDHHYGFNLPISYCKEDSYKIRRRQEEKAVLLRISKRRLEK